jgi:hypothetical protein
VTQTFKSVFAKLGQLHIPLIVGTLLLLTFLLAPRPTSAWQWSLKVGAESNHQANQADAFLPNEAWIYAGDSIQWTWQPINEPHTVTFLEPGQTRPAPPPPFGPPSGPPIGPSQP